MLLEKRAGQREAHDTQNFRRVKDEPGFLEIWCSAWTMICQGYSSLGGLIGDHLAPGRRCALAFASERFVSQKVLVRKLPSKFKLKGETFDIRKGASDERSFRWWTEVWTSA